MIDLACGIFMRDGLILLVRRVPRKEALIFGYFGGAVNVTDGRHTYHRFPTDLEGQEIYQYTLMPTHITQPFTPEELRASTLAKPFSWTKDVPS
jgi:hypothetical protein